MRSHGLATLAVVFLCGQLLFLAEGRLSNSFILSNQEDEIALQGKESTSPENQRFAGLAGRQNNQAGGIPVAFGENAPDTLPARVGADGADADSDILTADSGNSKLEAAQSGDIGPVPGSAGTGRRPGGADPEGQPGASGQPLDSESPLVGGGPDEFGQPHAVQGGVSIGNTASRFDADETIGIPNKSSIPLDSLATYKEKVPNPAVEDVSAKPRTSQASGTKSVKKPTIKAQKVSGQPQQVQNRLDSGSSYERGLRMIYFLEKKGGRLALNREQAAYLLKLVQEIEGLRYGDNPVVEVEPVQVAVTPVNSGKGVPKPPKNKGVGAPPKHKGVGAPPKEKGQASPPHQPGMQHNDDGDRYRHAFLLLYALEQKGGRYAVTPSQAQQLLRLINVAEAQKTVVPEAQRSLPEVLTAEQQSFVRAALSVEAAKGKRTDPALLNSYAEEVLRLTK